MLKALVVLGCRPPVKRMSRTRARRGRLLVVLPAILVGLASCSAGPKPDVHAPPAPASPAVKAAQPGSSPSEAPASSRPDNAGDHLQNVRWERIIEDPECNPDPGKPDVVVGRVAHGDLTGDGLPEAFVAASCFTLTSSNPEDVRVFDGASDARHPRLITRLLNERGLYLRDIHLAVAGDQLRVEAQNLSDHAALCCADQRFSQSFTWSGTDFQPGKRKITPLQ